MADLRVIKNVLSGSQELTVTVNTANFAAGENSIFVTLDNDLIIDDGVFLALGNTDVVLKFFIQYPTGALLNVIPTPGAGFQVTSSTPYQLNDDASDRNMWFRVPKWTTLQIFFVDINQDGGLQISIIGRG